MVDFQLKLFAESLNSCDNNKTLIEKSLINDGISYEEIMGYENIIYDLFKINSLEKKLGLELTQKHFQKSYGKFREEKDILFPNLKKRYSEEQKNIIDTYFKYSYYRTDNYLGISTMEYEKKNKKFIELFSALEMYNDLFEKLQQYDLNDRNTILNYYYKFKNNKDDIKAK